MESKNENEHTANSGLDDPPCSPLVAPGAIADTLELIDDWAGAFKAMVHPVSLVLRRAANTIRDLYSTIIISTEERDRLEQWKKEGMIVISEWESVWEAAGKPGRLGQSKAAAVREIFKENSQDHSPTKEV